MAPFTQPNIMSYHFARFPFLGGHGGHGEIERYLEGVIIAVILAFQGSVICYFSS